MRVDCFELPTLWRLLKEVLHQHPRRLPETHCSELTKSGGRGQNSLPMEVQVPAANLAAQIRMNEESKPELLWPIHLNLLYRAHITMYGKCLLIRWDGHYSDGGDWWWRMRKGQDVHGGKHWLGKSWVLSWNILSLELTHWTTLAWGLTDFREKFCRDKLDHRTPIDKSEKTELRDPSKKGKVGLDVCEY